MNQKGKLKERISIITIGVKNLQNIRNFYEEKFGWIPVAANKDIIFFRLNGLLLSFYPSKDLASGAGKENNSSDFKHFTLAYNVDSKEEVDVLYNHLKKAEVSITKSPEETFFGAYIFYFEDIESNLWEIAYNPMIELDPSGNVVSHQDILHLEQS
ncbi:VOC family protein [Leptospira ilyithenensis]|uniref:VOC family protein n=1 Tax=Leptospira ilyithenensis TaxID=2484901 RepID=A0A4R9LT81_9LEPT|nr:VOC family protein [Leptospira ilyithenensis]TGN13199.1 VOC family protein [Leptospira ilyithenensis]